MAFYQCNPFKRSYSRIHLRIYLVFFVKNSKKQITFDFQFCELLLILTLQ